MPEVELSQITAIGQYGIDKDQKIAGVEFIHQSGEKIGFAFSRELLPTLMRIAATLAFEMDKADPPSVEQKYDLAAAWADWPGANLSPTGLGPFMIPPFEPIFLALGHALYEWQGVERGLLDIVFAVSPGQHDFASIAFFQVNGKARLRLLDTVIEKFRNEEVSRWKILRKAVDQAMDDRNAFAHYEVTESVTPISLTPSLFDISRHESPDNIETKLEPYRLGDIIESTNLFKAVSRHLWAFAHSLERNPQLSQSPYQPDSLPPLASALNTRRAQEHLRRDQQRQKEASKSRPSKRTPRLPPS